jgi:hypothetical protein
VPQKKAAKVFDVDVKIAEDRVVRIEMNEDDDPALVAKQF